MGGLLDADVLKADLTGMIGDLYADITGLTSSGTIEASVTDIGFEAELQIGGDVFTIKQTLIVRADEVTTAIAVGNLVQVDGTERMIGRYTLSSDGVSYTIDVVDVTTG